MACKLLRDNFTRRNASVVELFEPLNLILLQSVNVAFDVSDDAFPPLPRMPENILQQVGDNQEPHKQKLSNSLAKPRSFGYYPGIPNGGQVTRY
jgi:hypothetical protein